MAEHRRLGRGVRVAGLAVALMAMAPGAAHALTASLSGGVLRIEAAPGDTDNVTLDNAGSNEQGPTLAVRSSDTIQAGAGCIALANDVGCPLNQITSAVVTLGDRNDDFDGSGFEFPMTIDGGDGDDDLEGGEAGDTITGGAGRDELHPGSRTGGDPVLNVLDGGIDDDTFLLSSSRRDADDVIGGNGRDTAEYSSSGTPVIADLDGVADDGDPTANGGAGEQDNLRADVENVKGGSGPDQITGNALNNNLDGRGGDDDLTGLDGDDDLTGGTGRDRLLGGNGNDILRLVDGIEDRCSTAAPNTPPGVDTVDADLADQSLAHVFTCLGLPRFTGTIIFRPKDEPGAVQFTQRRLKVRADGTVPVALSCPAVTRGHCHGELRLTTARGTRVLAESGEWTVRKGRAKVVVMQPVDGRLAALRALRTAKLTTEEQGPSRVGPRTSIAYLPIGPA